MLAEFLTREFAKKVITSAISLTAANYTSQGIQKGIDFVTARIQGRAIDSSTTNPSTEAEPTTRAPLFEEAEEA